MPARLRRCSAWERHSCNATRLCCADTGMGTGVSAGTEHVVCDTHWNATVLMLFLTEQWVHYPEHPWTQCVILESGAAHIFQNIPASHGYVSLLEGNAEVPRGCKADGLDPGAHASLVQELQDGNVSIQKDGVIIGVQNDGRNLQIPGIDTMVSKQLQGESKQISTRTNLSGETKIATMNWGMYSSFGT